MTPLILFWTQFFHQNISKALPSNPPCPYTCNYSFSHADQQNASARVFHAYDFNASDLPVQNPNAYNVYFTVEAPPNSHLFNSGSPNSSSFENYFNFTMTYRSNADVYFPYDVFVKKNGTEKENQIWTEKQVDEHISRKSKSALVAISNCHVGTSGRNTYIKELKNFMEVTQVGNCNQVKCDNKCLDKLMNNHHFYLAFENSVCPEYTTEKFWRVKQLIVPIVLSRAAMHPSIPPDSYIAASDFECPQQLASYLTWLMKNKDEYKSYFNWTKSYRRTTFSNNTAVCELCQLVTSGGKQIKNYKNEWNTNECIQKYGERLINDYNYLMKDEAKMAKLVGDTCRTRDNMTGNDFEEDVRLEKSKEEWYVDCNPTSSYANWNFKFALIVVPFNFLTKQFI